MSKIDYQALREAAEKATWGDWDSYKPHRGARGYEVRLSSQAIAQHVLKNNAEFIAAFNPKIALALLDERERNQQYIKRRDQENEEIALTVGKLRVELEAAENNLIDSECHVAELEEALRDKQALLEASEKRIAELEAELVSQTYKLNELSGNSPVTPDGWISCSERMPDTKTAVLVAVEFGRKGDWRMKWATYIPGHPDANDGWIIPGASWKPSHWMPLPEPPL
ncbi:TPA: ead/Ea22-like family protein [Escherichia albertii]|uniref:ead/Ea22-like family protein n=1 Tax=Escherichia albertii TaxID=208962 RepID=UPI0039BFBA2F